MVKFNLHLVNEPLLKFGNWVKIEFDKDSENDVVTHLTKNFPEALRLAQTENLHKVEIEFPSDWTRLPNNLQRLGFLPALKSYLLPSDRFVTPSAPSVNLSSATPEFDNLLPILQEQSFYHSQLYPEYYKSTADIDWEYYRQYLEFDLKQPTSLFQTFLNTDHQPIGFIIGGQIGPRVILWELIVTTNSRSQGIGKQLLAQFVGQCSQKPSVTDIEVETGWNQPAINFYLKFGFTPHTDTWYQNI
jgi:GNAT superfamily N-acetyltransferase